jgi:putative transcriptional regulator
MIFAPPRLDPRPIFTAACLTFGMTLLFLTPLRVPCERPAAAVQSARDIAPASGRFLVATESMPDPTFRGTRILIIQHTEMDGTLGVILDHEPRTIDGGVKVANGGPVDSHIAIAVHSNDLNVEGTRRLNGAYSVSPAGAVSQAIRGGLTPQWHRVFIGYSGWAPGQLDGELAQGVWRVE